MGKILLNKKEFKILYDEHGSITKLSEVLNKDWRTIKRFMVNNDIEQKKVTKYSCDENYFEKNNEGSFYWAGFLAADGCLYERKNYSSFVLKITLSEKDKDHLVLFKKNIESNHPVKDYISNNYLSSEIQVCSSKIFNDLKRFNITPRKTHSYSFPSWLINHEDVHHFIRGYVDGDGSFSIYKAKNRNVPQFRFSVRGTENFLTKMHEVIDENCGFKKIERKLQFSNGIAGVGYSGNKVVKSISNFLYQDATIFLDRKYRIIEKLIE